MVVLLEEGRYLNNVGSTSRKEDISRMLVLSRGGKISLECWFYLEEGRYIKNHGYSSRMIDISRMVALPRGRKIYQECWFYLEDGRYIKKHHGSSSKMEDISKWWFYPITI